MEMGDWDGRIKWRGGGEKRTREGLWEDTARIKDHGGCNVET